MKQSSPFVSFIIPVYNESANLVWHHKVISDFMAKHKYRYEIVYVEDGSKDNSLQIVRELAKTDAQHISYIAFSRNFGKEAATTAGMHKVRGDVVLAMDADGQHPITVLPDFIKSWQEGNQVVVGVRGDNPSETWFKKVGSKAFYRLLHMLDGGQEVVSGATDFRLLDRVVVDQYNTLTERNRVTRNLIDWLGFKRSYIPFHALERHGGVASYSLRKKFKLALDGMIKHSTRPLKLIGGVGVLISFISVLLAFFLTLEKYGMGDPLHLQVTGTAIIALILSFLIGIVLVCQGLLALYLENVYHETQNRPLYVVSEESHA